MKANPIPLPAGVTMVKTCVQAQFHLNNSDVLVMPMSKTKTMYIRKSGEDEVELLVSPIIGSTDIYTGDFTALSNIMQKYDFYVVPGSELVGINTQELPFLQRMWLKFQTLIAQLGG